MNLSRSFIARSVLPLILIFLSACAAPASPAPTVASVPTAAPTSASICPQPSPKVEVTSKEMNLFTWPEYVPDDVINCFAKVYGIKVNHDTFSSPEEMYSKLSKGASGYDVAQPADYMVQLMVRQKMLLKMDKTKLTVMQNFGAQFLGKPFDPNSEYTLPYQVGSSGIAYNSATMKIAPTSYADLWNKEYAGRLIMLDDPRTIIGMTLLTLGYDVNTTDPKQLAEAKAKLAQLIPSVRIFDSDSPKAALIAGDVDLGVIWSGETLTAHQEKPSILYVYPSEGVMLWQDSFSILADAPHVDTAYAWMNYLYQPDVFWRVTRDHSYTTPDTAALDWAKVNQPDVYKTYMDSNVSNMPADAAQKGHWLTDLGEAAPLYDQLWTEVKGK